MKANSSIFNFDMRWLISCASVLLWVVGFDFVIGTILETLYFRQKSGFLYQTTYAIQTSSHEIIILGNSRANHHYDPRLLSDYSGMTCYNAGRDGQGIFYIEALMNAITRRTQPRLMIVDISPNMFFEGKEAYDRMASLLPYYHDDPNIKAIVDRRSIYEPIKTLSRVYPYNSLVLSIVKYNIVDQHTTDGFIPLKVRVKPPVSAIPAPAKWPEFDPRKLESLNKIARISNDKGIPLVFVISPYLDRNRFNHFDIDEIRSITEPYGIPLLDLRQCLGIAGEARYFADHDHLNQEGAMAFTRIFCDHLKLMDTGLTKEILYQ